VTSLPYLLWWVNDLYVVREHFKFHSIEKFILSVDYGNLSIMKEGSFEGEKLALSIDYDDFWFVREGFTLVRSLFFHCCYLFVWPLRSTMSFSIFQYFNSSKNPKLTCHWSLCLIPPCFHNPLIFLVVWNLLLKQLGLLFQIM
jgi:hypothetical protein